MVREVASKTNRTIAGDGTTTATVLAQAIYREGAQDRRRRRHNPHGAQARHRQGRRRSATAIAALTAAQRFISKPVSDHDIEVAQVGTISANNDSQIGTIIAEAMKKVGKDGVITVEESRKTGNAARRRRRHAVRPRLPLALLRHRRRAHGSRARKPLRPHLREEDQRP